MPRKILPRIGAVAPGDQLMTLRVRWDKGGESLIDVSGMIKSFRVYAPLRQSPELFCRVRVGEHGTDVVWTDEIDMAADTLWRLAQEQAGETMTPDAFRHWRECKAYTLDEAARALGLSRRMVAYYEKGDRPIPRVVALAARALDTPSASGPNRDTAQPGDLEMVEYEKIEVINEIARLNVLLRSALMRLAVDNEQRKINRVAQPQTVYFFNERLWWSHRLYPVLPEPATQDNNLFGYGRRRSSETLISEIEVNLPIGEPRNVQGAFVRNLKTGLIKLAHRGNNVRRGRRSFSLHQKEFRDALETAGATLTRVSGYPGAMILVCSVQSPQLQEISDFVDHVYQAKNACS